MRITLRKKKIKHIYAALLFPVLCICVFDFASPKIMYGFQTPQEATLHWGELQDNIQTLNPLEKGTDEERFLQRLIYGEPLFYYDPYNKQIMRGIIENWNIFSPDSLLWILSIREGIVFHDNSPITPEDIRFSINVYKQNSLENNMPYNLQLDKLKEIQIVSPGFFQIYLHKTVEDLSLMLADIPILSREYYNGETYAQTIQNISDKQPHGCGPYRVRSFYSDSLIILNRHISYYQGTPEFEQIILKLYATSDQIKSDFGTGKLDFIQINGFHDMREISKADTNFQIIQAPTQFSKMYCINFNSNDPILAYGYNREALNMAFSKNLYHMSNSQFNVRSKAFGPLPESSWAFFEDLEKPGYNPVGAKDELRRRGWRDSDGDGIIEKQGMKFSLELLYPERDKYLEKLIQYIRLDLNKVGIAIEPIPLPYSELSERIRKKDFQMALDYFKYYPKDIIRTFYDFFCYTGSTFSRSRLGADDEQAIRQLNRAARYEHQEDAKAIFELIQDLYRKSYTCNVLSYQHHQYFAINSRTVKNFMRGNRLLSPAFWKPVK